MKSTNYEVSHYAILSFLCYFSLGYSTLCWLTVLSICFYTLQDSHKTRTTVLGNVDLSKVSQSTVVVDPLEHQVRLHGKVSNTLWYTRYRLYTNMTLMCQILTSANIRNEFTVPESKLWNNLPPIINTLPRYNSIWDSSLEELAWVKNSVLIKTGIYNGVGFKIKCHSLTL